MAPTAAPPLPDQKTKGWEFTDLDGLDLEAYAPAEARVEGLEAEPRPDGVIVLPLREAAERFPELLEPHLGSLVPSEDPFVARNDAAWGQGVFVYVPAGVAADPARITITQNEASSSLHWRTLIVLEEGAEAEVWETYESGDDQLDGLFNGVAELVVGDAARLRYICTQRLAEPSWMFATQKAEVGRDAAVDWVALGFGSGHGKHRMETRLAGQGADARVTGAYAGRGSQHLDFDTRQEHAAPSTTSDLAFRGLLTEKSSAVWRGMIRVDEGAQKTDAFQESRNLLLSKQAHADAIPGLEIEADDVRCTHAAAVAQVDAEQLFYLRSRGLSEEGARSLIVDGFLQALVERLAEGRVRDDVGAALEERLALVLAS